MLVPGVLLALIAERSGRDSLELVIGRQLAREAGHTASRLTAVVGAERETLASFARQELMREVRVSDIDKRISIALSTLRAGNPARVAYLVMTNGGGVVASSDSSAIGAVPRWLVDGEVPGELPQLMSLPDGDGTATRMLMATSIPDPDDPVRVLGTLLGVYDWLRLTAVTEEVRRELVAQGIAADVLVSDAAGVVLGGARSSTSGDAAFDADFSKVAAEASPTTPDFAVDATAGLIIGRAALGPDLPDWNLLVVEPRAHALAPARQLSTRLAITMGLAVLAALAISTLAAERVVRPLSELTGAIRELSSGGIREVEVPVRTSDEVGTLAHAFNEMAADLDRTQRDLVEAEKFAFVGELASGVAHEIRTSLGVLRSASQILERSLPEGASGEANELAEMIHAEVGRLGGVVDDLLTLDRARPLELESAPLSEPILRATEFVRPQARACEVRLEYAASDREAAVLCESELIYQLAVNLIVNAIQAVPTGGRVEVTVLPAEPGFGGFEVRDDGPGIPEDLREKIFQPFVTVREGGVGLGLTFVKRVVHDHRGRIDLASDPGEGTAIRIHIPTAEPA